MERAGEICGARGYDLLSQTGDRGALVQGGYGQFTGQTVITRNALIACR